MPLSPGCIATGIFPMPRIEQQAESRSGDAEKDEQVGIRVDLALVHFPVVNKNGETIGSAVTNLDIHDIARAARTFGVDNFYIVTPFEDQQKLTREILDHWLSGHGAIYNGKRGEALSLVRVCSSLEELVGLISDKRGKRPLIMSTGARKQAQTWSYDAVRQRIFNGESLLVLFGTAWGLAPEALAFVDAALPPITGAGDYNHLSVRAAAAIVLDRLLGETDLSSI